MILRHDTPVSPNLAAGAARDVSVYPSACCLGERIVCVYRRGTAKHSRDGVFVAQSSPDGGTTWSAPVTLCDRLGEPEPESVHTGVVAAWDGAVWAFFTTVEAKDPEAYIFSQQGRTLRQRAYLCRSDDGLHWDAPVEIELQGAPRNAYLSSRPLALPTGRLLIPVEGTGEHGQELMMGCFLELGGTSLSPLFTIAHDTSGTLGFGDGKFTLLPDRRILMLTWTYVNASEKTIQVHRCVSSDGGCRWSPPTPTNVVCQIMTPLSLADGSLIAAGNVRTPPEGIRLLRGVDAGAEWIGTPLQLWDARQLRVTAEPLAIRTASAGDEGLWDALPSFTFGSPELTLLPDGDVVMTYYAVVNDVTHVRACRFTPTSCGEQVRQSS